MLSRSHKTLLTLLALGITLFVIVRIARAQEPGRSATPDISAATKPLVPGDENWDDRFGLPGVDAMVQAIAVGQAGQVAAVGSFFRAGGVTAHDVARWDGRMWSPLGTVGADYSLHAVAVAPNGDIYVGGNFTQIEGVAATAIARWSVATRTWSALGSGLTSGGSYGKVNAITIRDGVVYAGGAFTHAGGQPAINMAAWNGSSWSALGSGTSGEVYALAAHSTGVYAGGWFEKAGDVVVRSIARWNGSQWSALGVGVQDSYGYWGTVSALAFAGNQLYVAGDFVRAGGIETRDVAQWDTGTAAWSGLAGGVGASTERALAIAASSNGIYVGGAFTTAGGETAKYIARWDGTRWSGVVDRGVNGVESQVVTMASSGNADVFVGGWFREAGAAYVNYIARLDTNTHTWHTLGQGVIASAIHSIAVAPSGDVYIGGQFSSAGNVKAQNVARWDGRTWHDMGGGVEGIVSAVAVSGDDVYVGGYFTRAGGISANYIARYNRVTNSWHRLGNGVNSTVRVILVSGENVFVGGEFDNAGAGPSPRLARWHIPTGTWHRLGTTVDFGAGYGSRIYALAARGPFLYVGGSFRSVLGNVVNSLVKWDSSTDTWYSFGEGLTTRSGLGASSGYVYSLAVVGSELYVGGDFNTAGGVSTGHIAVWNETTGGWSSLQGGVGGAPYYGAVAALAAAGTDLYVGGRFAVAGDIDANQIALWSTTSRTWSPLGGGITGPGAPGVNAIAIGGSDINVGGSFLMAGGKGAGNVAQFHTQGNIAPTVTPLPTSTRPPTATATPARTPTPAPTMTPVATATARPGLSGISGRISSAGQPAVGITLSLMLYTGSAWTAAPVPQAVTDSQGLYQFASAASLSPGQAYYVRFSNSANGDDTRYVWAWYGRIIDRYTAGGRVSGGDFDIADVRLGEPNSTDTRRLPITFNWTPRGIAGDEYYLHIYSSDGAVDWLSSTGSVGAAYTLTEKPNPLAFGTSYFWDLYVANGDGFGVSLASHRVVLGPGGRLFLPQLSRIRR